MRVEVPATGLATPLVIDLGGAGVRGLVVSAEDAPVSGAWVQVDRTGESGEPEAGGSWSTTRQDGTFRVEGLEPGTYQVRVSREGAAPLVTPPVTLGPDEVRDLGRLALASGAALSGRVTDDEGTPVEDATISLDDSSGRPVFSFSISTTGSDGRYRVPELRPGRYTVRFEARGYGPATMPVTLGPEGATLDATLSRGGEIRSVVEDAEGNRVPGARVTIFDSLGRAVTRTLSLANLGDGGLGETDSSGVAVLPDLAPGSYRVTARKSGLAAEAEPVVAVAAGRRTEARLVLRPAGN
jgi:protocatechuate 3,4-dioxygenase beta subunit